MLYKVSVRIMVHLIRPSIRSHASQSFTRIPHMNDWMTNWDIEIHTYVRVEGHDVEILNDLIFPCLIV